MSELIPVSFPSPRFNKADIDKWLKDNLPPGWKALYIAPVKSSSPGSYLNPKPAPSPTPDTRYDIWPAPEATDEEIAKLRASVEAMLKRGGK